MSEPRTSAIAIQTEPGRAATVLQSLPSTRTAFSKAAVWAGDTAQKFGALVSALMGPAVFSAYAFAFWSLAANLGWTNSFIFTAGPLSNWLVWVGIAILTNVAASVLLRHTQS
jgi:hypothetical protein